VEEQQPVRGAPVHAYLAPLFPWAAQVVRYLSEARGVSLDKHSPYDPAVKVQDKRLPSVNRFVMVLPSLSLHMQSCRLLGCRSAWFWAFLSIGD
jgi:hypothetical protein